MIKKYAKRYQHWQEAVPLMSPFVICCGIIAITYFFYRVILLVSPAVILERAAFHPVSGSSVVCSNDEDERLKDPQPILSAAYQKRIHGERATKPNAVVNPSLSQNDPATSEPVGYSRTTEGKNATYSVLSDGKNKFLRAVTKKPPATGKASPAWQADPVALQKGKAYSYSFWYRSGAPVDVSLEYKKAGKTTYQHVTTLQASRSWQQFAAHVTSGENVSSLRVTPSLKSASWIDTRAFDIHQIPDATLDAPLITITFDDGWQSVSDEAADLLKQYGIRTTQYVISDIAGQQVPGYMNFVTLKALKDEGHEIGSHTLRHCNQASLGQEDLERNASASKRTLEEAQLGPITSFAYPLGQYSSASQAVYQRHYPLIRTSDFGYNDRYFDETNIRSISITNTTSDKQFKAWIDEAKKRRLWVVFSYHQVEAKGKYSVTSAQLERQLKMVKESGAKVLPLSEAAATIRK